MTEETFKKHLDSIPNRKSKDSIATMTKNNALLSEEEIKSLLSIRNYLKKLENAEEDYQEMADIIAPIYARLDGKTTPLLIRQVFYYILYRSYELVDTTKSRQKMKIQKGNHVGKEWLLVFNTTLEKTGYTKYLSHNYTGKDKWNMPVIDDYCADILNTENAKASKPKKGYFQEEIIRNSHLGYKVPTIPYKYAGHKDGYLGYMLKNLVESVDYKNYVELYGGSGIGIMQHEYKAETKEYINDLDARNACFYRVLSTRFDEFIALCENTISDIKIQADKEIYAVGVHEFWKRLYRILKGSNLCNKDINSDSSTLESLCKSKLLNVKQSVADKYNTLSNNVNRKEVEYCLGLWRKYNNYAPTIYVSDKDELEVAYRFLFLNSFLFSSINQTISGATNEAVEKFLKTDFRVELRLYAERMKKVTVLTPDNALKYIQNFAGDNTLFYSDSPYIASSGYEGLPPFLMDDMKELVESLLNSGSNFIFSCKNGTNSYNDKGILEEDVYDYDDLLDIDPCDAWRLRKYVDTNTTMPQLISIVEHAVGDDGEDDDLIYVVERLVAENLEAKKIKSTIKAKAARYEIIETLKMFKKSSEKLFVYYAIKTYGSKQSIKYEIQGAVVGNSGIEMMISNIDCDTPDFNEFLNSNWKIANKENYDTYRKVPFDEFVSATAIIA